MPAAPTPAFDAVNKFLGWGEPDHGLWFIGIEEASGWAQCTAAEIIQAHVAKGVVEPASEAMHAAAQVETKGPLIRSNVCRIAAGLSTRCSDWRQYLKEHLWKPGSKIFEGNLYPLGKARRSAWPATFELLFGFGVYDTQEYLRHVEETRFEAFKALRENSRPQAIVCFGTREWPTFANVFVEHPQFVEYCDGSVRGYPGSRVVMCPFFGQGHMTLKMNAVVVDILKDWGVRLLES